MKTWKIPVSWTVVSTVEVEAETLSKAIERAEREDFPLSGELYYLDESWKVGRCRDNYINEDYEEEYIRDSWNNGQEDD